MLLNFCCFEGKAALYSSSSTVLLIAILMQVINNKVPLTNLNRKCYSRKQAVIAIGTINCCFTLCLFAHLYYLFLILTHYLFLELVCVAVLRFKYIFFLNKDNFKTTQTD